MQAQAAPWSIQAAVSFDGQEWAWMPQAVTGYTIYKVLPPLAACQLNLVL